jgi:hypothetical protein
MLNFENQAPNDDLKKGEENIRLYFDEEIDELFDDENEEYELDLAKQHEEATEIINDKIIDNNRYKARMEKLKPSLDDIEADKRENEETYRRF